MAGGLAWTEAQDERVRKLYRLRGGPARLAREMGRTIGAITSRANRIGVHRKGPRWSRQEEKVLRAEWGEVGARTLCEKLPGRSAAAIAQKAAALGLPPQIAGRDSVPGCAERLGVHRRTVLRLVADAGGTPRRMAPISVKQRGAKKWLTVDLELVETLLRQRDLRCSTSHAYAQQNGLPLAAAARAVRRVGLSLGAPRGGRAWVPDEVFVEALSQRTPGPACDLWLRVFTAAPGIAAPWVLWLAVTDLLAGGDAAAWVGDVLPQKTVRTARILAGLRPEAAEMERAA